MSSTKSAAHTRRRGGAKPSPRQPVVAAMATAAYEHQIPRVEKVECKRDWTDFETPESLRFRLNTFNLSCDEHDDVQAKLDATRSHRTTELVEEWKRIYNDKQNERFDFASQPEQSIETSDKEQIQCALDYYKDETEGGDYEFVKCEIMVAASLLVAHTNFYARRKGTDFSPELFFAVLENGSPQKATHCCKLDPRFYMD